MTLISKMPKILVVGGGLTSAITSSNLNKSINNVKLYVWDKARGAGGRMATSRCPSNPDCTADLGAQYITRSADSKSEYYEELISNGLLAPLNQQISGQRQNEAGVKDFVTPKGSSSLVKHYFSKADVAVQFEHHVSELKRQSGKWAVTTLSGKMDRFDAVILTMPTPQVVALVDGIAPESTLKQLKAVKYSSRYGLACFFDKSEDVLRLVTLGEGVCAKYIEGDPVIRYVSIDTKKRLGDQDRGRQVSVVFHTSVPFGIKYVEQTPDQVKPLLLEAVHRLYPDWPQPDFVKCQKWRFSQVTEPYPGSPGFVTLSEEPLMIVGGDGFLKSGFDGCVASAEAICEAVKRKYD